MPADQPPPPGLSVLEVVLIVAVLIFFEALFVAAEIALVSIRRSRIEQLVDEGSRSAKRVQRLLSRPGHFLAVIQIGITFVALLASAFAAESQVEGLREFLKTTILAPQAGTLALLIVTAVISLATILFGELLPKTLALSNPERFALFFAGPVEFMGTVFRPLVWVLTRANDFLVRLVGVRPSDHDTISSEELRILVERGGAQGTIEAEEEQMIGAVLELGESRVHEVMVPRIDIVSVPADIELDDLIDTIVQAGHSRIPVYDESIDNVIGILYAKDLLPYLKGVDHPPAIRTLLRTPLFVPESLSVDDLLHEFQRRKVHIAIVLDEYSGTAGLVTIEDLIEEIVGEIQDEYDVEEPMLELLSDHEARVDGRANIDDLAEAFDLKWGEEDAEEFDTVGGLVYHHIGGIPQVGDVVNVDGLTLTVESTDGRRVGKVLAVRRQPEGTEPTDDQDG
jgi:putative hemolysin